MKFSRGPWFAVALFLGGLFSMGTIAARAGNVGFSAGVGAPYLTQFGLHYVASDSWSFDATYGSFALDGDVSVSFAKPELAVKWHPFAAALYLGLGFGYFSLSAEAESDLGVPAEATVTAPSVTPMLGWLWGKSDGGFIIGTEVGYQVPVGGEIEIESELPETNETYEDAEEQAEALGQTGFVVITLLRIGYLF